MKLINKLLVAASLGFLTLSATAKPVTYTIDDPTMGSHAFINFKVSHLGYSWLFGRFDKFEGSFVQDNENPANEKVEITIDTRSLNSNHAERDKHLRSADFVNVAKHPQAKFVSTGVTNNDDGTKTIKGNFTLNGVTKAIEIQAKHIGEGEDPWGGYRSGFEGSTQIEMKDFNFKMDFGTVHLDLHVEGIRK